MHAAPIHAIYHIHPPRPAPWPRPQAAFCTKELSRLDVVKQCFTVLAERSLALALPLAMGMVQVDEQLTVASEIQDSLEDFNVNLERVDADGETKLWDACAKGADLLEEYASARTAASSPRPGARRPRAIAACVSCRSA